MDPMRNQKSSILFPGEIADPVGCMRCSSKNTVLTNVHSVHHWFRPLKQCELDLFAKHYLPNNILDHNSMTHLMFSFLMFEDFKSKVVYFKCTVIWWAVCRSKRQSEYLSDINMVDLFTSCIDLHKRFRRLISSFQMISSRNSSICLLSYILELYYNYHLIIYIFIYISYHDSVSPQRLCHLCLLRSDHGYS